MDPHLLLAAAEACGPAPIEALLDPTLDPHAVLHAPPPLPPAPARRLADRAALARTVDGWLAAAGRLGLHVLTPASADYPQALRTTPLRPLVLFGRGDLAALQIPGVAIVGSRTPTPYGIGAAQDFSQALCATGLVPWSGLAAGVDAIAHRVAVARRGPTVAVLAGGLDAVYPAAHATLAAEIVACGGLVLSEAPPGLRATRGHFPRRNRILAGAVGAVLVVEAGLASGTLHTARFAAEAGVDVFAVPGPYTSPRSRGCHDLIAEGAQIARDPEDWLRRLGIVTQCGAGAERTADELAILAQLGGGPRPADLVQRESRLDPARFLEALFTLTQSGRVLSLAGDLLAAAGGPPVR